MQKGVFMGTTVFNLPGHNTIRILDDTASNSIETATTRAFQHIDNYKPKGFFNKLKSFFSPPPLVEAEVKCNGISFLVDQNTNPRDVQAIYDKARLRSYEELGEQFSVLQKNINLTRDSKDFSNMSKHIYIANNMLLEHNLKDIPQTIKDKCISVLESTGLIDHKNISSPQAAHLGFLSTQIIEGIKKNSFTTLAAVQNEIMGISTKEYNIPSVMVASTLDTLASTISIFNAHKIGFQNPDTFIDVVGKCVNAIVNDEFMSEPLKRQCTDRMVSYLKAAGFESSIFTIKPEDLNQSNFLKHQISELMRAGATYNYDHMGYAPAMLVRYKEFKPEVKITNMDNDSSALEKHIAQGQDMVKQNVEVSTPRQDVPTFG